MLILTIQEGKLKRNSPAVLPYIATVDWDGVEYQAISSRGAAMDLARILVAAGCCDQAWEAHGVDGRLRFYGGSIHRLAQLCIHGNTRFAKWEAFDKQRMGRYDLED